MEHERGGSVNERQTLDRADRMINCARRRKQVLLTVNGVLCPVCAAGADPQNILRRVAADSGEGTCYNCDGQNAVDAGAR